MKVVTDNHKLFWPRTLETDAFSASFDKPLVEDNFLKVIFFLSRV